MKKALKTLARNQSGQGMTEYIIIVALIAVLSIGAVSMFGNNVRNIFGMAANALTGDGVVDTTTLDKANANSKRSMNNLKDYKEAP